MNAIASAFGATAAHSVRHPGRRHHNRISLGRALRERLRTLRRPRPEMTCETAGILHASARAHDSLRVRTERARVLVARQVL